jgi:hypothetical protein
MPQGGLDQPHDRRFPGARLVWLTAAVLGGLRTGINDGRRAADRDRGVALNRLADLTGAFAELVGLRHLELLGVSDAAAQLLDRHGHVDDVDLTGTHLGQPVRLEVKAHLEHPGKRLLLVNTRALRRSVERGAQGFLPVVGRLGHDAARIGRLIEVDDVAGWPVRTLPPHHDPAYALTLVEAADRYFAGRLYPTSRPAVPVEELDTAFDRARASVAAAPELVPDLDRTDALSAVRRLTALLGR